MTMTTTVRDDQMTAVLNVAKIRKDFPILQPKNGEAVPVYLDNAATTLKPQSVIAAVNEYYEDYSANVHRSIYEIGERATAAYEGAREKSARFINAPDSSHIIFTSGTTEAINLVTFAWGRHNLGPGDEILITEMEHHSNIVPWQLAARDTGATLRYIPITEDGSLDLTEIEDLLNPKTKIISMIHQSNVFGTLNPVAQLIARAKDVGAPSLLDAAQSVPHSPVDVTALDCDFLAFSGHKMLGPTGIGVLYARRELQETMEPFQGGGEMIQQVTMENSTWNDVPWKFEAGTPNIAQAIGLGAAIDYITSQDRSTLMQYEKGLTDHAMKTLLEIPGLTIYGDSKSRGPVVSFNVEDIHPHDLAQILDKNHVAVRAGHHCAQPIMSKLGVSATARASFYFYNTMEEIDMLSAAIKQARNFMGLKDEPCLTKTVQLI